jgi:hypothetical protein
MDYAETTYAALDAITLRGFVRCAKCDVTLITAWQRLPGDAHLTTGLTAAAH